MDLDYFATEIKLSTVNVPQRVISGYAAVHHNLDRVHDILDPGATSKAIARLKDPAKEVGVFVGHNSASLPIGLVQKIEAHPQGMYTETYVLKGPVGDNLLAVAKDLHDHGHALGMSIGYRTRDSKREHTAHGMARRLLDLDLKEYSFAAAQAIANPLALTTAVKSRRGATAGRAGKAMTEGSDAAGGALVEASARGRRRAKVSGVLADLSAAAAPIKHSGDYGYGFWNAAKGDVWWVCADSDSPENGFTSTTEIRHILEKVPGVRTVTIEAEAGPQGGMDGWQKFSGGSESKTMQCRVEQQDGKWLVYCDADSDGDADDNRLVGTYASEEIANAVALALRGEDADEPTGVGDDTGEDDMQANGADKTAGAAPESKAVWTAKYQDALPNSSFLYVEGGEDDGDGRRVPRSKRHFPVKDAEGKADLAHVRNAIARIPQSDAPGLDDAKKAQLQARARRMLEHAGDGKTYEEPAEWKTGSPLTVWWLGTRLRDLSEQLTQEHKAMVLLGEEHKAYQRIRPQGRDQLAGIVKDLVGLIAWAETLDRGEDGRQKLAWYRQQLALAGG